MDLDALGSRILQRRETLRLTQRDVAVSLQVSAQAVSKWERAENAPDLGVLVPLSRVLGVSTDWLFGNSTPDDDTFDATVFASDLIGSTAMSERLQPRDAVTWINARLFEITEVILRHEGIPVSYVGDMCLAVFAGGNHQDRALQSALAVQMLLAEQVRIGLDSGQVYFLTLGHPNFSARDVLGRPVDRAVRLADLARRVQGNLAATAAVVNGAAHSYGLELHEQMSLDVAGSKESTSVYSMGAAARLESVAATA